MERYTYIVTSDIHGDGAVLQEIVDRAASLNASRILIAGDLCPKSPSMSLILHNAPCPYVAVKGNCDWMWDFKDSGLAIPREQAYLACPDGHHVAMTHGHNIVDSSGFPFPLADGDILIQGHTHVPQLDRDCNGVIHLNPGSPTRPRSGYKATYAVISESSIEVRKLKGDKVVLSLSR